MLKISKKISSVSLNILNICVQICNKQEFRINKIIMLLKKNIDKTNNYFSFKLSSLITIRLRDVTLKIKVLACVRHITAVGLNWWMRYIDSYLVVSGPSFSWCTLLHSTDYPGNCFVDIADIDDHFFTQHEPDT
jgi:hypothetical protein